MTTCWSYAVTTAATATAAAAAAAQFLTCTGFGCFPLWPRMDMQWPAPLCRDLKLNVVNLEVADLAPSLAEFD